MHHNAFYIATEELIADNLRFLQALEHDTAPSLVKWRCFALNQRIGRW
jgi:hypothetical protein